MGKYFIDHIYWALETGFLNLSGGVPDPMDGSDVHQAFNPCQGDIEVPRPKLETKVEYTSVSLDPDPDLSFTKDEVPGQGAFPGGEGMIYHNPFLQCCAFTHKTVTGTWSGGASTYGQITGDFSDNDDRSSIMIQTGMTDGSSPINRCYNGVLIASYQLGFKKGDVLREMVDLVITTFASNTQAFIPNANFDNGYWSLWALKNESKKVYHATDCKLYWDEAHTAELAGLAIEECRMKITTPHASEADSSQLYHEHEWDRNRTFECTVSGIMTTDTEYLEVEKLFTNKVKKDLRLSWDQTANELKWMQIDDAWIEDFGAEKITSIENARRLELRFLGESANWEGNYENLPDPSTRIDT